MHNAVLDDEPGMRFPNKKRLRVMPTSTLNTPGRQPADCPHKLEDGL